MIQHIAVVNIFYQITAHFLHLFMKLGIFVKQIHLILMRPYLSILFYC